MAIAGSLWQLLQDNVRLLPDSLSWVQHTNRGRIRPPREQSERT
jgi:hypothetical protein